MKLLLVQNIDHRVAGYLREAGHDVTAIAFDYPHGLRDEEVLAIAFREQRILITYDRADFGKLIFRHGQAHCGVILLRLLTWQDVQIENQKQRLLYVLTTYQKHLHHFLVSPLKKFGYEKLYKKAAYVKWLLASIPRLAPEIISAC